jgi:hypothetical protein
VGSVYNTKAAHRRRWRLPERVINNELYQSYTWSGDSVVSFGESLNSGVPSIGQEMPVLPPTSFARETSCSAEGHLCKTKPNLRGLGNVGKGSRRVGAAPLGSETCKTNPICRTPPFHRSGIPGGCRLCKTNPSRGAGPENASRRMQGDNALRRHYERGPDVQNKANRPGIGFPGSGAGKLPPAPCRRGFLQNEPNWPHPRIPVGC